MGSTEPQASLEDHDRKVQGSGRGTAWAYRVRQPTRSLSFDRLIQTNTGPGDVSPGGGPGAKPTGGRLYALKGAEDDLVGVIKRIAVLLWPRRWRRWRCSHRRKRVYRCLQRVVCHLRGSFGGYVGHKEGSVRSTCSLQGVSAALLVLVCHPGWSFRGYVGPIQ